MLYVCTAFAMSCLTSSRLLSCVSKSQPFFMVLFILSARALCSGSPARLGHAYADAGGLEYGYVLVAAVLHAAIRVVDEP